MKMHYRTAANAILGEGAVHCDLPSLCNMKRISDYLYALHCRAPSYNQIYFFFSEKKEMLTKSNIFFLKYQKILIDICREFLPVLHYVVVPSLSIFKWF